MHCSATDDDYPEPTALDVKFVVHRHMPGAPHLASALGSTGLLALLTDIGTTAGSCGGGHGCSLRIISRTRSAWWRCCQVARSQVRELGSLARQGDPPHRADERAERLSLASA